MIAAREPKYVAVHDDRLKGTIGSRQGLTVVPTNATTTLGATLAQVRQLGRIDPTRKIHTLFILCHGYAGTNSKRGVCMDAGGMGLQFGKEGLSHANVSAFNVLKDEISNIVVYACAAANTERGNEYSAADGRYLMGAIATHANATVYAGDRIQWYSPNSMRFGAWEGRLLIFRPGELGRYATEENAVPVELDKVPEARFWHFLFGS